jgi:hypothetical protein
MDPPSAIDHLGDVEIYARAGQTQGMEPGKPILHVLDCQVRIMR